MSKHKAKVKVPRPVQVGDVLRHDDFVSMLEGLAGDKRVKGALLLVVGQDGTVWLRSGGLTALEESGALFKLESLLSDME